MPLYVSFVLGGCVAVLGHRASGDEVGLLVVAGMLFVVGAGQAGYRSYCEWVERRRRRRIRMGDGDWDNGCCGTVGEGYRDDDDDDDDTITVV